MQQLFSRYLLVTAISTTLVACGGGGSDAVNGGSGVTSGGGSGTTGGGGTTNQQEATTWEVLRQGTGDPIVDVAWNGTRYVAISDDNYITSTDSLIWKTSPDGFFRRKAITWGNGMFVAVGNFASIATSPDGLTWTNRSTCNACLSDLLDVVWNGAAFVSAGEDGLIYRSEDGVNWQQQNANLTEYDTIYALAAGNGRFVAVGTDNSGLSQGLILYSDDGISWQQAALPDLSTASSIDGVMWDGNRFIASASYGEDMTSSDGQTWVASGSDAPDNIVWDGSKYLGACFYDICTSADGVNWSTGFESPDVYPDNLTYAQATDRVVAVGTYNGWNGSIVSAPAGNLAAGKVVYTSGDMTAITSDTTNFYALDQSCRIFSSADGVDWTTTTTSADLSGVCTNLDWVPGLGKFVLMTGSELYVSDNLASWTSYVTTSFATLNEVVWTGTQLVAVTSGETVYTSADGTNWNSVSVPGANLNSVAWSPNLNMLVAVGASGDIFTSVDGSSWTERSGVTATSLNDVAWFNNRFIAVGGSGTIVWSTDGVTWYDASSAGMIYNLYAIEAEGGKVYMYTTNTVYASSNGADWTEETSSHTVPIVDAELKGDKLVAVGDDGTILTRN